MRRLRRSSYIVPTLSDTGPAGKRRKSDRTAFENDGTIPTSFPGHWTKPDVKGLLHAMQARVCAYCGISTSGLDVEHFRPKGRIEGDPAPGGYWWLAYEGTNYFLGCTVCNQKRKSTGFPLSTGAVRCTYAAMDTIGEEKRILLDAVADPIENWLTIEWNDPTCKLIPHPDLAPEVKQRIEDVIDFFGLNLDAELRTQRSKAYEEAVRAANEQRWDDLRRKAMRHAPHSLVARFVLTTVAKERIPDDQVECQELIQALWIDLVAKIRAIGELKDRGKKPDPLDERELKALGWALVVIQSDPPGPDAAAIVDQFAALMLGEPDEVRKEILALFKRLKKSDDD